MQIENKIEAIPKTRALGIFILVACLAWSNLAIAQSLDVSPNPVPRSNLVDRKFRLILIYDSDSPPFSIEQRKTIESAFAIWNMILIDGPVPATELRVIQESRDFDWNGLATIGPRLRGTIQLHPDLDPRDSLLRVTFHEIGHNLGLDHVDDRSDALSPGVRMSDPTLLKHTFGPETAQQLPKLGFRFRESLVGATLGDLQRRAQNMKSFAH